MVTGGMFQEAITTASLLLDSKGLQKYGLLIKLKFVHIS